MKRTTDIILSLLMLLALTLVCILITILIKIKIGSPILFTQMRPGKNGIPFKMFKFRTMTTAKDEEGNLLPDDQRLTPLGIFLRKTSLDELPELINIIKGDMSLVGPRPLLMEYNSRYNPEQAKRLNVKPGLTGWAQVNGRNSLSWDEKFKLDTWYVENQSFWLDLYILVKTLWVVFFRKGTSHEGHATMPEFK